jgi:hypothetical protein
MKLCASYQVKLPPSGACACSGLAAWKQPQKSQCVYQVPVRAGTRVESNMLSSSMAEQAQAGPPDGVFLPRQN